MLEYIDIYPQYTASGFSCTNEVPNEHRKLLKGERMGKSLAIASGGEITFFVLLPKVRGKLICVDHSYRSLIVFHIKALMLTELGVKETKRLMTCENPKLLRDASNEFCEKLPGSLKPKFQEFIDKTSKSSYDYGYHPFSDYQFTELVRAWKPVSEKVLEVSRRKLDQITLVHGDITDVAHMGPYTHAYISNALEHITRSGGGCGGYLHEKVPVLLKALGPDCKVITTAQTGKTIPPELKAVKSAPHVQGSSTIWSYHLLHQQKNDSRVPA